MKALSLFLFALISSAAWADVFWLNMGPTSSYMDINTACHGDPLREIYFGAETSANGQVMKAAIRDTMSPVLARQIVFNTDEVSSIELFRDKHGRSWLKTLPLSGRIIVWLMSNGDECRPMHPLATMGPVPYKFEFSTDGLGESVLFSRTPRATFKGQRKDGGSYRATLELMQSPFKPRP